MLTNPKYLLSLLITIQSLTMFAHGENKAGPNGGHIQMPGAFHTELLVESSKKTLKVFLLDLSFKNPVVKESKVEVSFENGKSRETFKCKPIENYFECQLDKLINMNEGNLVVKASRLGVAGKPAIYKLPLSFDNEKP